MSATDSDAGPAYVARFLSALPLDRVRTNVSRQVEDAVATEVVPTPVPAPRLLAWVPEVAELLDLPAEAPPEWVEVLGGNRVLPGMRPYAACYGGHQFGNWAGQLGDGRAITLGERVGRNGVWEIQLKGAGPTPYSRRADGRAVLRSSLRELVCSEAMFHLGVPTTRALGLVATGAPVLRDMFYDGNAQHEPGAITCRVAPSFLRFGSYEIHAAHGQLETLGRLVDFTVDTFFPELGPAGPDATVRMFNEVCRRTAVLMAHWLRVGFVHGVMNTDNMSILGLTIDYGPYGWVEPWDLNWTPNTTDASMRRYRFGAQPTVARWNLARLADALSQVTEDRAGLARGLEVFTQTFAGAWGGMLRQKLGLREWDAADDALVEGLFTLFEASEIDMTLFFRGLADVPAEGSDEARRAPVEAALYADSPGLAAWLRAWADRVGPDPARAAYMNAVNPIVVPRNWQVQEVIDAVAAGDNTPLERLMDAYRRPYDAAGAPYALRRPEWARHRAGCSMLSCSS